MATADQRPLYLDASALTKLVAPEPESTHLLAVVDHGQRLVSSELVLAEVPRALRRMAAESRLDDLGAAVRQLEALLAGFVVLTISRDVLRVAGRFPAPHLRALDAIHLAGALLVDELALFISYDRRQLVAAEGAGLATASPGWS